MGHLSYKCQYCYNLSDFQQKICSSKSYEKIQWYIKNFINEKIEIKSVCFVSNKTLYRKPLCSCFSKSLPLFIIQGKNVIVPNGITAIGLKKLTILPKFYQKTMSLTKKFNKHFEIILVAILKSTLYFVAIQMRDNQVFHFCSFLLFWKGMAEILKLHNCYGHNPYSNVI